MSRRVRRSNRRSTRREKHGARINEQTNWVNPRGNMMFGFPDRMITTLTFWEQNFPTWAAETYKVYSYRGTSVYDPRTAAGGVQPEGFDLFALVYSSYRVLSSKLTLSVASSSTGISPLTLICCPVNADPASYTAAQLIAAANNPYGMMKIHSFGGPMTSLTSNMTTARIFGSEMVNTDDNFASLVSTNPNNNWYWAVGMYVNAAFTATSPYAMNVKIEFKVQFYDRFVLADALVLQERLNAIRSKSLLSSEVPPIVVPVPPGITPVSITQFPVSQ